jgi:hypothetical protein
LRHKFHSPKLAIDRLQISILIAGGYYNGRVGMYFPLTDYLGGSGNRPSAQWQYVGSLSDERQWGPAVGLVAGTPVIATGKNYGDGTIEQLLSSGSCICRSIPWSLFGGLF